MKIPEQYTETRTIEHWGETYEVTPAVVEKAFGDGRRMVRIQPLNTRPDYYLVRVDSSWDTESDDFHDRIEDIYEAIEEQYSEKEIERGHLEEDLREQGIEPTAENTDLAGNEDRLGWPVLDHDCGVCWETVAMLPPVAETARPV